MKKTMYTLLSALLLTVVAVTTAGAYTLRRVSVHDPSIVYDPAAKQYYIFGSHRATARSTDLMAWTSVTANWGLAADDGTVTNKNAANSVAFTTNMTKTVTIGGEEVTFGNFDALAWSAAYGNYDINGNMWAPDVIYNKVMEKWCMYLSINGPTWNSSIILLAADKITGPYVYQGPVVFSGFNVTSTAAVSYKNTDLELAIGTQASLPSRYNVGDKWGRRWPHCIDPCVFYDEEGQLWMSYGSWSGGIWMLRLNEQNGLRDYDVSYPSTNGTSDGVSSDPYFGKKIAGGYYVSGEASYIEHIGNHYFLFVTNGGLEAAAGYQMRVFRSDKPDGPYRDANGTNAIFTSYKLNFGPNSDNRGVNILGAYGEWGNVAVGDYSERAQGHNSIIAADDGRTYLVYHTRFQNRGEGHEVRVHQVFQNADGWLCAAPFEYTGETVTSADIATTQQVADNQAYGVYKLLIHRYGLDHKNKELATPVSIQLNTDGTISGAYSGRWQTTAGTSYITLTIGGVVYKGVLVEQTMERTTNTTVAFTAMATSGVTVWGYREKALPEIPADADIATGVKAYYNFDDTPVDNLLNTAQTAALLQKGANSAPTLTTDDARSGNVLHINFGAAGSESYAEMPNPLYGADLNDGCTIAFWTNVAEENLWDALFAFYNPTSTARLYMTGNTYIGFNNMSGNWIDLNYPTTVTNNLSFGAWNHVVVTLSRTKGIAIYIDGKLKTIKACNGSLNGTDISSATAYDYNLLADHVEQAAKLCLGYGSFWGSPNAYYDELLVFDRPLTATDAFGLYTDQMMNGSYSWKQNKGDVNGDGKVNVGDIMAVINVMAGLGGEAEKAAADINGDGAVNVGDIMAIINIMAEK